MRIGEKLHPCGGMNGSVIIACCDTPKCIAQGDHLQKMCNEKHVTPDPALIYRYDNVENISTPVLIFIVYGRQVCLEYEEALSWISQQEDGHPVFHNLDIKKYQEISDMIVCTDYCLMDPYSAAPTFTSQFGLASDYEDEDFDANPQMGALYDYDMQAYREELENYVEKTKEYIKRWEKELDELVAQEDRMLKESGILDLPGFTCEG